MKYHCKGGVTINRPSFTSKIFFAALKHRDMLKLVRIAVITGAVIAALAAPGVILAGPDGTGV